MIKIDVYDNAERARIAFEAFYELIVDEIPFRNKDVIKAFNQEYIERYPNADQLNLQIHEDKFNHRITDSYISDLNNFGVVNANKDIVKRLKPKEKLILWYKLAENVIFKAFPLLGKFLYSDSDTTVIDNEYVNLLNIVSENRVRTIKISNLGKLLCGYMDDPVLDDLRNSYKSVRKNIGYEEKLYEYVFCYERISKNKDRTYAFVNSLGIRVCPYCNRNYIQVIRKEQGINSEFQTRPPLDHFINKDMYPFFSISMMNLVPACWICNSGKSNKDRRILYPYREGISDDYHFSIKTKKSIRYMTKLQVSESEYSLEIEKNKSTKDDNFDMRVKESAEMFGWNDTYEYDKSYALKVYQNAYIFNDDFCRSIVEAMPYIFNSIIEVHQILNPKLVSKDSFNLEPLSKLIYDISEQARSMHDYTI